MCATLLFAWQSLGFSDSCTLASTHLGLPLSSGGKWGQRWSDKSAVGRERPAQKLGWTSAQLTQLPGSPHAVSWQHFSPAPFCSGSPSSGFREASVKDARLALNQHNQTCPLLLPAGNFQIGTHPDCLSTPSLSWLQQVLQTQHI